MNRPQVDHLAKRIADIVDGEDSGEILFALAAIMAFIIDQLPEDKREDTRGRLTEFLNSFSDRPCGISLN